MAAGWLLVLSVPILALIFVPAMGNAFSIKQELGSILIWTFLVMRADDLYRCLFRKPTWLASFAFICLASIFLSTIGANNRHASFDHAVLQAGWILAFLLISNDKAKQPFETAFFCAVCGSAAVLSIFAVAQKMFPAQMDFGVQALGKMQAFSTLGNPNYVACYVIFALPLFGAVYRRIETPILRITTAIVFLVCLVSTLLTGSRSAWLALSTMCCVWVFLKTKFAGRRVVVATVAATLLVSALYMGAATHTGRGRILIWAESIQIWMGHPVFGVGPGNFNIHQMEAQKKIFSNAEWSDRFVQNASFVFDAHNEALNVLAETGALGLVGWLGIIGIAVRRGIRASVGTPDAFCLFIGWLGQLIFSLWNAPFFYAPLGLNFWIGAALLANRSASAEPPTAGRHSKFVVWRCLLILIILIVAVKVKNRIHAGFLEHRGDRLLETGPFDQSTRLFSEAARLNPAEGYLLEKWALSLYFEGHWKESIEVLNASHHLYGDVGIPYLKAEILARQERFEEAANIYVSIAKAFPNHITPPFMLGQIYLKMGLRAEAGTELRKVLEMPMAPHNLKLDREKVLQQKEFALRLMRDFALD